MSHAPKRPRGSSLPSAVQMLRQRLDVYKFAKRNEESFGSIHTVRMFNSEWLSIGSDEGAREVLLNKSKNFENHRGWSELIGPFFHGGLMLMDGEKHRIDRKVVQSFLSRSKMSGYATLAAKSFTELSSSWERFSNGGYIRFYPLLKEGMLTLSAQMFLGMDPNDRDTKILNDCFVSMVRAGGAIVRYPLPFTVWKKGLKSRKIINDILLNQVETRRLPTRQRDDLLSQMANDAEDFTDQEIVDHLVFILMAAHDTSTTVISTMVWALASDGKLQDEVREELLSENFDPIAAEAAPRTTAVFREASRLYPPVPILPRYIRKNAAIDGYRVRGGTLAFVPLNILHRRASRFENPHLFDAERFFGYTPQAGSLDWAPFGLGMHRCVGAQLAEVEAKLFLRSFLTSFSFRVKQGYSYQIDLGAIPRPKDGLPIFLQKLE